MGTIPDVRPFTLQSDITFFDEEQADGRDLLESDPGFVSVPLPGVLKRAWLSWPCRASQVLWFVGIIALNVSAVVLDGQLASSSWRRTHRSVLVPCLMLLLLLDCLAVGAVCIQFVVRSVGCCGSRRFFSPREEHFDRVVTVGSMVDLAIFICLFTRAMSLTHKAMLPATSISPVLAAPPTPFSLLSDHPDDAHDFAVYDYDLETPSVSFAPDRDSDGSQTTPHPTQPTTTTTATTTTTTTNRINVEAVLASLVFPYDIVRGLLRVARLLLAVKDCYVAVIAACMAWQGYTDIPEIAGTTSSFSQLDIANDTSTSSSPFSRSLLSPSTSSVFTWPKFQLLSPREGSRTLLTPTHELSLSTDSPALKRTLSSRAHTEKRRERDQPAG